MTISHDELVLAGVHSVNAAEKLDEFLARGGYPLPIAVGSGSDRRKT